MITQIRTYVEGQGIRFNLITPSVGGSLSDFISLLPTSILPLLTSVEVKIDGDVLLILGVYGSILVDSNFVVKALPSLSGVSIVGTPSISVLLPLVIGISNEMKPLIQTINFDTKTISMFAVSPELDGYVISLEYPEAPPEQPEEEV